MAQHKIKDKDRAGDCSKGICPIVSGSSKRGHMSGCSSCHVCGGRK